MRESRRNKMARAAYRPVVSLVLTAGFAATAPAQTFEQTITNGVVCAGHLDVTSGSFGSFAAAFNGGPAWLDQFIHTRSCTVEARTFSTNLFLFTGPSGCGGGGRHVALSEHAGLAGLYYDGDFVTKIIVANHLIDDATSRSVFQVTGGGVNLRFELTQHVDDNGGLVGPNGEVSARLAQTYTITNQGNPVDFVLVRHLDPDLQGDDDGLVGADFAELGRPQVFAQNVDLTETALILRTREDMTLVDGTVGFFYYCGKQFTTPPGNPNHPCETCPEYGLGTDFQIWDNYGTPNCWKNFVPEVGYDIPGISPFGLDGDSHLGLQLDITLDTDQEYTMTFETIYGLRPLSTICNPPILQVTLLDYDLANNCATFAWGIRNNNPFVPGQPENPIETFYIDVEAGDGAQNCADMTGPDGWTVENCTGWDDNNHALFKFTSETPIEVGEKVFGRLTIDANGDSPTTNPDTGAVVEPMAVLLTAAQGGGPAGGACKANTDCDADEECNDGQCVDACQQEEEVCANGNYDFGPTDESSDWSIPIQSKAFKPVPALFAWSRVVLTIMLICGGTILVRRSRRTIVA